MGLGAVMGLGVAILTLTGKGLVGIDFWPALATSLRTGVQWFAWVMMATSVGTFVYALLGWGGPRRLARLQQQTVVEEILVEPEEPDITRLPVIRGHTPAGRLLPSGIDLEVHSLEPTVDPQIKALYEFLVRVWPTGNVARDHCIDLGFGRAEWERYVGGQRGREGEESGRGLLDRAGYVYKDASGHWQIAPEATLEVVLGMNEDLAAYARKRARLVRLG